MATRILVVDRDEAFATMLQHMLETEGGYKVEVTRTGSHALILLQQSKFDLTIIDTDLDPKDLGYRDLILSVRQLEPAMRLMLIPLMGEELPPGIDQLDIQAVLSKPFFADDLLPNIESALAKQVASPLPAPAKSPATSRPVQEAAPGPQALLAELAREINADAIVLLSTSPPGKRLVAHVSHWDRSRLETLADLSIATVQAAQATARFLGQPDEPFEHNMFENASSRLYIMAVAGGDLLIAVTSVNTPLGTIRHNLRRTARSLLEIAAP